MAKTHVVIVTGMSGSGRSTAIKALEDIGFFCIDNLPIVLLDKVLVLTDQQEGVDRVALGVDVRERGFLASFQDSVTRVREQGHRVDIIFLDASDDALVRRYSETRRRHPLGGDSSLLVMDIMRERRLLSDIRQLAGWVIDTSDLNVHQLNSLVRRAFDPSNAHRMTVSLVSFGFKFGVPRDSDYVFDCRFLPNPFFEPGLRDKTGKDPEVREFLSAKPQWSTFLGLLCSLLDFTLPLHREEGKPVLTVSIGCTGGRHRSVAVVEDLYRRLKYNRALPVRMTHRDVANDS